MGSSSEVRAGEQDEPAAWLSVATVARRLGIAPSTLRTWDRRYGLGPSAHRAGSHRRYTPEDLDRLVVMRRLTLEGISPADAARLAIAMPVSRPSRIVRSVTSVAIARSRPGGGFSAPAAPRVPPGAPVLPIAEPPPRPRTPTAGADLPTIPTARAGGGEAAGPGAARGRRPSVPAADGRCGGGKVFALPDAPQARGLARAAMALDSQEMSRILEEAIAAQGVVAVWNRLAVPVLQAVGERWASTGGAVDVEHLFSQTLQDVLRMAVADRRPVGRPSPVLLGCAEDEFHTLPLLALAAGLAERGIGCRLLGAGMPTSALVAAARRTGPAVVFLQACLPVGDPTALAALLRQRPSPRLVLGGPGWAEHRPPASARRVGSLAEAIDVVLGLVRG